MELIYETTFKIKYESGKVILVSRDSKGSTAKHVFDNSSLEQVAALVFEMNKAMTKVLNNRDLVYAKVNKGEDNGNN
jgi:hypothetical protein